VGSTANVGQGAAEARLRVSCSRPSITARSISASVASQDRSALSRAHGESINRSDGSTAGGAR